MDRQTVYPGQIPLETDLLNTNKNVMIALGKLAGALFGTSTYVNGLSVVPNSPAALNVVVNPGEIYSLANIDGTAYSSLAADTTHSIVKQGIMLDAVTLSTPAPVTAGQSINYLIQAQFSEVDGNAVVLPFYNASNPSQAYSGPNGAGTTNNTQRKGTVVVAAKAGIAATTGSQTTPAPDSGYVGLYVVSVANGQSTVTAGNITQYASAPIYGQAALLNALNAFTVSPTAPTPALGDNSTKLATTAFANATGSVVGSARNAAMSGTTFTVDEVVLESALGGAPVRLANVNKTINLATTGAGGMDTGAAPTSGYVGIYLIYNPTTQTANLLAVNATAAAVPEIYGGANMPAGYTHSALVAVLATTAGGALGTYQMNGRTVHLIPTTVASGLTSTTYASFSLSAAVPKNAKAWGGWLGIVPTASTSAASALYTAATSGGLAEHVFQTPGNTSTVSSTSTVENIPILTVQTGYYKTLNPNGNSVNVANYTF